MKKEKRINKRICPKCGNVYLGVHALSRVDGKTQICPDCGTREALVTIGISKEEQDKILKIIHDNTVQD